MQHPKTVYVLGGYGFIGAAAMRALRAAGFRVVGAGRSRAAALASDPGAEWLIRDLAAMTAADWAQDLGDADIVVNAAGALQDGARDDVAAIHDRMIARIIEGLGPRGPLFIQVSAAGARADAPTAFMASKARGDAALMASCLPWVVLRPVLVLGTQAYGGTALLRAAAAMPGIGLMVLPDAAVQTVHVEDVAAAVVRAARGEVAFGTCADLTEARTHTLGDLTRALRARLGLSPWRWYLTIPAGAMRPVSALADALGWLRWRSPLRHTAMASLAQGVTGDPQPWAKAGGPPCRDLADTLAALPATAQERAFARLYLLLPLAIATLSLFWIASGLVGLARFQAARAVLTGAGMADAPASLAVTLGSLADIALGGAILWRPAARAAAIGMIALSLAYLLGAAVVAPHLWADPLGPMLKVLPGIALALFPALLIETR